MGVEIDACLLLDGGRTDGDAGLSDGTGKGVKNSRRLASDSRSKGVVDGPKDPFLGPGALVFAGVDLFEPAGFGADAGRGTETAD